MEDQQPQEAPAVEAPAEPVSGQEQGSGDGTATEQKAPVYDWRRALDEAPTEEVRRHPKFAGIVGSEKQSWEQQYKAQQQAAADAAAREKAEADLRELAERNPVAFADKWLSSEAARQQQKRLEELEYNARQAVGKTIGAAFHTIPEWEEIARDPDALAALATAMQGKDGDQVLAAWNAAAADLVAHRRAEKLAEARLADRLKAERAAWETEAAAQGFVRSDRPDLVRGGRIANADPEPDFIANPKDWNAWYRRTTGVA